MKVKKNKRPALAGAGLGILTSHIFSVVGDFSFLGVDLVKKTYETIVKEPVYNPQGKPTITDTVTLGAAIVAGFLLGNRIMGYTYRISRGLVNSVTNYCRTN